MSYYNNMETPNKNNLDNMQRAMKNNSQNSSYTAKMSTSYTSAAAEYRKGNIKEGDAKFQEGRKAADEALKKTSAQKQEAWKNYCEYSEKYKETMNNKNMSQEEKMLVAEGYSKKANEAHSDLKCAESEEKRINEYKTKGESEALAAKENITKSRTHR